MLLVEIYKNSELSLPIGTSQNQRRVYRTGVSMVRQIQKKKSRSVERIGARSISLVAILRGKNGEQRRDVEGSSSRIRRGIYRHLIFSSKSINRKITRFDACSLLQST